MFAIFQHYEWKSYTNKKNTNKKIPTLNFSIFSDALTL